MRVPHIGDDEIIELATLYDGVPPSAGKADALYLRDAAYYACGYGRLRAEGLRHTEARDRYHDVAWRDDWYIPAPSGMPTDNAIIEAAERWTARYQDLGRYQRQSRPENGRDITYWMIVYLRAREAGRDQESAIRAMERGMCAEAGQPDPYAAEGGGGSLSPLVRDGQFFRQASGEAWTAIESSDFTLFKWYLDGEPIAPILEERRALGFNLLRVWLLNQSVVGRRYAETAATPLDAGIHPHQYPDFYEQLTEFVRLCAGYDCYTELTLFTQTRTLMPDRADQQRHLDRTADAVHGESTVLLELVNEDDTVDNAVDPDLDRPPGVLISRGSNGSDAIPPRHDAPWDYECYHTNDANEFQRKVGHNAMEYAAESGRPCIANENTRYPDRDASEAHAYDAAMGGALLCAGSCFHSQGGKYSRLFDATERQCAAAWVAGAQSVPLEFQRGRYIRRDDLVVPGIIRAYEKQLADGRSHVIQIRA